MNTEQLNSGESRMERAFMEYNIKLLNQAEESDYIDENLIEKLKKNIKYHEKKLKKLEK